MNTTNPTCECGKTMDFDGEKYVCACQTPVKPAEPDSEAV